MTSIPLDTPASSGPPAARFEVGDAIVFGLVSVSPYHQKNFDTKELKYWPDGKPVMGKIVTGLVVSADGATVVVDDIERPVVTGDLVSFWCEGGKHFTWKEAIERAKGSNVGDVVRWVRDPDEAPKTKGALMAKKYTANLRRPEAKDGDLADRCVVAYHEQAARPALDSVPAAPVRDEEPF